MSPESPSSPSRSSSSPASETSIFGKILAVIIGIFVTGVLLLFGRQLFGSGKVFSPSNQSEYVQDQESESAMEDGGLVVEQENISQSYLFTATQDQTALELLQEKTNVEVEDYGSVGVFITGIDGLKSDDNHYWALYVNDEYAQVGASQLELQSGDQLKVVYEQVDPEKF